ncbi:MAG: outer membrane beta-barrel protein [Bdellovibrionota bacterium]
MKNFFYRQKSLVLKTAVLVEALALISLLQAVESKASSGPSWASQPTWSATQSDDDSPAPRRSSRTSRFTNQVAPYTPGSNNLAFDVGQVFLMGDLGSSYSDNIGAQIHYTYGVSDLFGFDSSLGYSEHSDSRFSMTTLLTGLRTNLSWYDKVIPYVVFGLGFYKPSYTYDLGGAIQSMSPVLFGVHLGPGVDLELTKQLFFGASITFHDVFGGRRTAPNGKVQDVGGTYTSFLLHAGVTF